MKSNNLKRCNFYDNTVKLGYNKLPATSQICSLKPRFVVTGMVMVYVLNMDLGPNMGLFQTAQLKSMSNLIKFS